MHYPPLYHSRQAHLRRKQRRNRWLLGILLVLVVIVSNRCAAAYRPAKQVQLAEPPGVWACL
jgi:hypothetical protein